MGRGLRDNQILGDISSVIQESMESHAKVIVPPRKTATKSRRMGARDRTILRVKKVGRRQWKEGIGVPPAGPRGEHLLQVQVDHWPRTSRSTSELAESGGSDRVQHPEPDACPRQARVLGGWCLTKTIEPAGMLSYPDSCTNATHRRKPPLPHWRRRTRDRSGGAHDASASSARWAFSNTNPS